MSKAKKNIYFFLYFFVSIIFFTSGFLKLTDTTSFFNTLYNTGINYYLSFLSAIFIPLLEIFIASSLLLFISPKLIIKIAIIFIVTITLIYLYLHFSLNLNTCNCFGKLHILDSNIYFIIIRNVIILLILLILKNYFTSEKYNKTQILILIPILTLSGFISGYTFIAPKTTNKHYSNNKNESINKYTISKIYNFDKDSTYMIALISYDCPHCINSIANANMYKNNIVNQTIFVTNGSKDAESLFFKHYSLNGILLKNKPNIINELTHKYPTFIFISQKNIKFVIEGELPSPFVLNKSYIFK